VKTSKVVCDPVNVRMQGANALVEDKAMTTVATKSGLTAVSGPNVM
jgi:hypothetical protein